MKKIYLLALIILLPILSACTTNNSKQQVIDNLDEIVLVDEEGNTKFNQRNLKASLDNLDLGELSNLEKEGILFMIEEEKLAHDVYAFLYDKWGAKAFDNISNSEKTHTEAVQNLASRYSLDIPSTINVLGKYNNYDLQKLYNDLTKQGSVSLEEAFKVGAVIEEIDILDLQKYISQTDKEDIKLVYDNLMKGSRNHLRSFVKNLERNGFSYSAQYLEQDDYNAIINSDIERGSANRSGSGRGRK